ncbi:transcription factor IBH1-like [Humulus lupulus]|uniref:transcription factor IBH1-like n=1 Tax=Humulus lupulus TaxID=3486 RepID=UPI002B4120DB|nr:transcription factor IBH1-like [Humulus lupulus]
MMDYSQSLSNPNPNSLKNRFTKGFIRALMRIQKSPASNSPGEISKRRRKIKTAANAAMASAVGSRKVWSQAVLRRIRSNRSQSARRHRRCRALFKRIGKINSNSMKKKRGIINGSSSSSHEKDEEEEEEEIVGFGQEKKLRKLVPGGAAMDICSLLDETAHYIRCLTTQVKVMKTITEICST